MKERVDVIKNRKLLSIQTECFSFTSPSPSSAWYDLLAINFEGLITSSAPLTEKKIETIRGILIDLITDPAQRYNEILHLTLNPNRKKFQIYNSVNVCLLSLLIGRSLHFSQNELLELGFAALMHDLGMFAMEGIIDTNEPLTPEQRADIRQHPANGLVVLGQFTHHTEHLEQSILQEHEREDGSGYPKGLNGKNIHEFAKIIAIADSFEALTHYRPYRPCSYAYEAVQTILGLAKDKLDRTSVNGFVKALSFFPCGTCVRLADQSIGFVSEIHEADPLNPVISLIYDAEGNEPDSHQTIDLQKEKNNYIVRIIDLAPHPTWNN